MHALQIAAAEKDVVLHTVRQDQQFLPGNAQRIDQRHERFGAWLIVIEVVDHDQRSFAGARVERTLAGEGTDLTGDGLHVLATSGTECGSTTRPQGGATRPLTGATGSLLLPRLLITAVTKPRVLV